MNHILHSIFLLDVINHIDSKYKEQLSLTNEKIFTYSNIFNMPLYYKLASFKKNADYNLYNKLQNNSRMDMIYYFVKEIYENDYDNNLVLLLYSYICNIILNEELDIYIDSIINNKKFLSKKRKMFFRSKTINQIEAQYYIARFNKKISSHNINTKEISIDEKSIILLNDVFMKLHYFKFGKEVFDISYKNFVKYQRKRASWLSGIHKFWGMILDYFTVSKKYTITSIYKVSRLSKTNYLVVNDSINFSDIYKDAIKKASQVITLISEEIYYKKKNSKLIDNTIKKVSKI